MTQRLLDRLEDPRALRILVLVGVILCAPMLATGFQLDDVVQQRLLTTGRLPAFDLFRFATSAADVAQRRQEALAPWWTPDDLRLAFFRPITAWTHAFDALVAPGFFPWHALQTAAWYVAACAGALAVYRKTTGTAGAAVLALACFALDDAHGTTLGWLANRNAIVAAAFGFAAVAAHLRERRALAALLLGLSLCSSETGLATLGYLASATLFLDHRKVRWKASIYLVPALVWAALWIGTGSGAAHSDGYLDPLGAPWAFVKQVLERGPLLLASQWTVPLCDAWGLLTPDRAHALARVGLLVLVPVVWLLWPLLREDRHARFLFAGSVLAVVPVCATVPASRLLLFCGLGASGLVATLVAHASGRLRRAGAGAMLVLHGVLGPAMLPIAILSVRGFEELTFAPWADALKDPGVTGTDAIALQAPVSFFAGYLPAERELRGEPGPARVYAIAPSLQASEVERLDDRTLRVTVDRGFEPAPGDVPELPTFGLPILAERLDRTLTDATPRYSGESVDMGPFVVKIVEALPDGRPATVDVVFDTPLEDRSLRFVVFRGGRASDWAPPPVGTKVLLPASPLAP